MCYTVGFFPLLSQGDENERWTHFQGRSRPLASIVWWLHLMRPRVEKLASVIVQHHLVACCGTAHYVFLVLVGAQFEQLVYLFFYHGCYSIFFSLFLSELSPFLSYFILVYKRVGKLVRCYSWVFICYFAI